jgi:hypothetical protein
VPQVDFACHDPLAVRRGAAMDDDAFDLSCHAAMMAARSAWSKAEGAPPVVSGGGDYRLRWILWGVKCKKIGG